MALVQETLPQTLPMPQALPPIPTPTPSPRAWAALLQDVDQLRMQVALQEARLTYLENRRGWWVRAWRWLQQLTKGES